ncbi:metal-dependent hydrolase [Microcoleus sp. B7-D4]|uniref:metal-dependent hydrolase n=1 Tax=Microcoleus sp. B7-D4 TaxID=2818696 RepID=UPI002FD0656F
MMALTHSIIAAAGTSFFLTTANPLHLALAIAGSQLPDIDTSTSTIGQILFPISNWIEDRFPHRSVTHCFLATCAIALLSAPLYFYFDWRTWICLPLGHLLSCFSDCFTKQGVQFFWPHPAWCISVPNPNRRLETGKPGEYWVLAVAVLALVAAIKLSKTGGPTAFVGTSLGLRSNATEIYQTNADSYHVYAQINGTFASDSSSADGNYFIAAGEGNEFVVVNKLGIFKTGTNIIASRLTAEVGKPATASVQTLEFDESEFAITPIPDTLILLTGTLTVDDPQSIKIATNPKQLEMAKLIGDKITFNYCPLETAIKLLSGQYITGSLEAKIFSPKPDV